MWNLYVSLNAKTTDELVERLLPIGPLERAKLVTEEYIPKDDAIKLGVEYFNTLKLRGIPKTVEC